MKIHLPKLIKKLITFPKIFPRAAHPRQLVLCMLFMIFAGAGNRGGLLWADQHWPSDLSATGGQIDVTSDNIILDADIEIRNLTLLVKGNVTIKLNGNSLRVGTLLVGGQNNGDATALTVTGGTLTVGTYDVANNVDTSLEIASGAEVEVTDKFYLNTNPGFKTTIKGSGTFDLSSASQETQYKIDDIGAVIDSSSK